MRGKRLKMLCVLLMLTQILSAGSARSEEEYWTNSSDRYYHLNSECNRPADKPECYERKAYVMVPVSEDAALEFGKKPCPVCVKRLQPVYIGEAEPEWTYEYEPWIVNFASDYRDRLNGTSERFRKENSDTHAKFEEYYQEIYDKKTKEFYKKHEYPECFAGLYMNAAMGFSYMIADPTPEIVMKFREMFGGGAWIIPAKYGQNEILAEGQKIWDALFEWCDAHPEIDAYPASFCQDTVNNAVGIGIHGTQWRMAAEAMEADAPVFVYFEFVEASTTDF